MKNTRLTTNPCVRPKRLRVCWHNAHMCFNMWAWCRYTRGVLNVPTATFFQCVTPHTTQHTRHNTRHKIQHTPTHGDRARERQRETERDREDREKREEKTKEERQQRRWRQETRQEKRSLDEEKRRENQEKRREHQEKRRSRDQEKRREEKIKRRKEKIKRSKEKKYVVLCVCVCFKLPITNSEKSKISKLKSFQNFFGNHFLPPWNHICQKQYFLVFCAPILAQSFASWLLFFVDVLHEVLDSRVWFGNLLFPTRM